MPKWIILRTVVTKRVDLLLGMHQLRTVVEDEVQRPKKKKKRAEMGREMCEGIIS